MNGSVRVEEKACKSWTDDGSGMRTPNSISVQCPHCGNWATFQSKDKVNSPKSRVCSAWSQCANCNNRVRFVFVFPFNDGTGSQTPTDIRMFPAASASYELSELPESVPEPLQRAMKETVRAYNSKFYGLTATSGRRTLEGIFKNLVPEGKKDLRLFDLIEEAGHEVDYKEPILRLSNAIREGGNLGAHFDPDKEPDSVMALQVVELLDYLISYLYVLPARIVELEEATSPKSRDDL